VKEAEAAEKEAAARLKESEAALAGAETDVEHTEIRAPFSGIVLRKEAELGEIVVPALAGGATSRGSVITMAEFASLELEVDVFERDIRLVSEGGPTEILINAFPDLRLKGTVRQVVPTADRTKGTVKVKVAFEDRDPRVLPEMAGKVVFLRERTGEAAPPQVLAPSAAVITRGDVRGVFVLEGARVTFRAIGGDEGRDGRVVVLSGLDGGERVVLDPPPSLGDGDLVRVAEKADG
jgi:RND family efflux transporter MFP subunit